MSAYFIVNCTIKDMDKLNEYLGGAMGTVGLVPVKVLVMDNECETVEGTPAGERTVVLEFESREDFRTWYDSPEYQAVVGKRFEATEGFGLLANGL
jgi:uncharacterized protein (DUF1330 family)